jgi:hypothetical protein
LHHEYSLEEGGRLATDGILRTAAVSTCLTGLDLSQLPDGRKTLAEYLGF